MLESCLERRDWYAAEFDQYAARYAEFQASMVDELIAFFQLMSDIELDRWADDGGRA